MILQKKRNMIKLPKISIIIPIYNVEEYITECLQSVMRQTYKGAIECILVDDCGTDNSIAIAEQLIAEYKGPIEFRILHHEHNRGLSAARNTGTDAATGDYIYYLDSDDYISDDCIEVLAEPLKEIEYDMVVGNYEAFGGEWNSALYQEEGPVLNREEIEEALYYKSIYTMSWNKLISMSLLRNSDIQFKEGILHEDELWTFEISIVLNSVNVIKKTTYYYRIRTDSIIGKCKSRESACKEYSSYLQIVEGVLQCAKDKNIHGDAFEELINYYVNTTMYVGLANQIATYDDYSKMHSLYNKPSGLRLLITNIKKLRRRLHWYMPSRLAYWFLQEKYYRHNK